MKKSKWVLLVCLLLVWGTEKLVSQQYFQQQVNFQIEVRLNDNCHELSAFERVDYCNNSTDTLQFLYFHLWPNAYSTNKTDLAKQLFTKFGKVKLFNQPELNGRIDSLDFKVNKKEVSWHLLPNQPDICKLILNEPLYPGHTITITTPFHVVIPKGVTSRLGHIGQSYQISQWYPKPAVYDKKGWHEMPYLDQGEFYSEFGNFDVKITLPANYIVAATGNLQNVDELAMLDQMAKDTSWIKTTKKENVSFPVSSQRTKTLHFQQSNVHDFAWFADKRFHVLKSKVLLPRSGKEVTTWLMFTNQQSKLWKNALPYINHAILDFSEWIGDYPYSNFTAVQSALNAGLGMEYPGITVIGLTKDAYTLDRVIAHEAAHNWFYGALGFNERRYPYLDEGITTAYESRYMKKWYPHKMLWEKYLKNERQAKFFHVEQLPEQQLLELEWLVSARNNMEQPVNCSSTQFSEMNYGLMLYNKAPLGFNYLRAYLGNDVFDGAMRNFYINWKNKHPQPEDLKRGFEAIANKNLSWFFDDLMGTTKQLDYQMIRYEKDKLLIKNVGELVSPLVITALNKDSIVYEKWVDGFEGQKWITVSDKDITEFKIDANHVMPELYRLNNNVRTHGVFPRADAVQPQLLLSLENTEKHPLMYVPAVNWNREDGFMLGVALHNGFAIPKPVHYFVMPFYSFDHSSVVGFGRMSYTFAPFNQPIQQAKFTLEGTRFGSPGALHYYKVGAGVELHFRSYNSQYIKQQVFGRYVLASDLMQVLQKEKAGMNGTVQLGYRLKRIGWVNPFNTLLTLEAGRDYQKVGADIQYLHSYNGKGNGMEIRFFAGGWLSKNTSNSFYALAPSGRNGRDNYLYDGMYPDRFATLSESVWSKQMTITEGGLVSPINSSLGYSKWLVSLSLSSSLPGKASKLGIKPFVDVLLNDHGMAGADNSLLFVEAGLKVGVWNFVEIYCPLLVTNNIRTVNKTVKERVRIVLNFNL